MLSCALDVLSCIFVVFLLCCWPVRFEFCVWVFFYIHFMLVVVFDALLVYYICLFPIFFPVMLLSLCAASMFMLQCCSVAVVLILCSCVYVLLLLSISFFYFLLFLLMSSFNYVILWYSGWVSLLSLLWSITVKGRARENGRVYAQTVMINKKEK